MKTNTQLLSVSIGAALLAASLGTSALAAEPAPAKMENGVLVGSNGKTLYVFDKDSDGKSMCTGKCAENWPPLYVSGPSGGDFGAITRDDGKMQATYKGKPLYYWSKDQKAGDQTGDGFNHVWHVAK